uniref:Uncharacterized protein n=1 Tax=Balaenoptera musculus TaxID=9771 RepID=A0A8C0DP08_BALMU
MNRSCRVSQRLTTWLPEKCSPSPRNRREPDVPPAYGHGGQDWGAHTQGWGEWGGWGLSSPAAPSARRPGRPRG